MARPADDPASSAISESINATPAAPDQTIGTSPTVRSTPTVRSSATVRTSATTSANPPASDIAALSALELAAAIRARTLSPLEALDACLRRVEGLDGALNALIWRNDDDARDSARAATAVVVATDPDDLAPFHGVPIPIKDLTAVAGWPLSYGSAASRPGPSDHNALVVDALLAAGFVLTGRTNTPELGLTTVTENVRYGITRNPWDLDRTPGGSSGGAAAAVAAGMFPVAHGSDGGGSIRIPASCCGLVGLKPSRGRVPALVRSWEGGSVDGTLTRDVADTAALLDVISGMDAGSWYNAPAPRRPFAEEVGAAVGHLRVGVVEHAPLGLETAAACSAAARATATTLESVGHHVMPASLELPDRVIEAFLNIAYSGLAGHDDIDWAHTEPHVQAAHAVATDVNSLDYIASVHELQRYSRRFVARWRDEFDVLVTPTMAIEPPRAGAVSAALRAEPAGAVLTVTRMGVFASIFNLTGLPAISLPAAPSAAGLPIGVQIVGGPWNEALVIRVASQLEAIQPWAGRRPDLEGAGRS